MFFVFDECINVYKLTNMDVKLEQPQNERLEELDDVLKTLGELSDGDFKPEELHHSFDLKDDVAVVESRVSEKCKKLLSCEICDYKCSKKYNLNRHTRIHTREKLLKCNICNCKFLCNRNLKNHIMGAHSGEKSFSCKVCDYTSLCKDYVKVHMKTHTAEKQIKCEVCDYKCFRKNYMKRHMITHTTERPIQCADCGYTCNHKKELVIHFRTHIVQKPFPFQVSDNKSHRDSLKHVPRKSLTLLEKVHIIGQYSQGKTNLQLSDEYKVHHATISKITKNKDKIMKIYEMVLKEDGNLNIRKFREPNLPILEEIVLNWFEQKRLIGEPVSGVLLRAKAKHFFSKLQTEGLIPPNYPKFHASCGWLYNFKKRHGLRIIQTKGEKASELFRVLDDDELPNAVVHGVVPKEDKDAVVITNSDEEAYDRDPNPVSLKTIFHAAQHVLSWVRSCNDFTEQERAAIVKIRDAIFDKYSENG